MILKNNEVILEEFEMRIDRVSDRKESKLNLLESKVSERLSSSSSDHAVSKNDLDQYKRRLSEVEKKIRT